MSTHPQIEQQITFFSTHNLNVSTEFYEQKLGLELWLDQGTCRIYTVSGSGYLGLCQASETSTPPRDKQSSVIFTLVTQQVDEWCKLPATDLSTGTVGAFRSPRNIKQA